MYWHRFDRTSLVYRIGTIPVNKITSLGEKDYSMIFDDIFYQTAVVFSDISVEMIKLKEIENRIPCKVSLGK